MPETTKEIDALVDELQWGHPETRKKAAIKLGRIRDKRVIPHLIKAVESDEYVYARVSAIQSLLWIADQSIINSLLRIVEQDQDKLVRRTAIEGLSSLKSRSVLSRLESALNVEKDQEIAALMKNAITNIKA